MEKVQSILDSAGGVLGFGGDPYATPVGSRVDKATRETLESEDWGLNMEIVDIINTTDEGGKDAIRAIKRKLYSNVGKSNKVILLTLTVLETCAKNCRKPFHILICEKEFATELINKIIQPKFEPPQEVQDRILKMIQSWAHAFSSDPDLQGVAELYMDLKKKGVEFPPPSEEDLLLVESLQAGPDSRPSSSASSGAGSHGKHVDQQLSPGSSLSSSSRSASAMSAGQTRRIQAAKAVASGKLTTNQVGKLSRDLDITERNMDVMSELLSELTPGEEHPEDLALLTEVAASCSEMQKRVMDLLEIVEVRELTQRLLEVNDNMNNLFLRYERFKNNKARDTDASATAATAAPSGAATASVSNPMPGLSGTADSLSLLNPAGGGSSRPNSSEVALITGKPEEIEEIEAWMKEHEEGKIPEGFDDPTDESKTQEFEQFLQTRAEAVEKSVNPPN